MDNDDRKERQKAANDNLLDWSRQTLFYAIYYTRFDSAHHAHFNSAPITDYDEFLNSTQDIVTEQLGGLIAEVVREHGEKAVDDLWNAGLVQKTLEFVRRCSGRTF